MSSVEKPPTPSVGPSTIAALIAGVPAVLGALGALVAGVETIEQAVVCAAALLAGAAILCVLIVQRSRQASALVLAEVQGARR